MNSETIGESVTMTGGENSLLAGRYRVVRQLGQGGMGSVWLAEDAELENRKVAIKMLPAILVANKRALRQLKSEALVSMRLVHPNIVQVRSFEENNGNPFLVSDYIEGQTLDDHLAECEKLSERETLEILGPIAAALDYAHGEGVVHRDVKPANVMLRADGRPFILDFGIAREIQETMTRVTGSPTSGTLLYMSPEQLHGDMPSAAQDVYSFAAMVYECLSGHPPFCRGEIAYQIVNDPPAPLDGASGLGGIVLSALAKKPAERPTSCQAVLAVQVLERQAAAVPNRVVGESSEEPVAAPEAPAAQSVKEPAAGETKVVTLPGDAEAVLVWCPTGKDSEGREMKGFWMGRTPVTQAQWRSVMRFNHSRFKGDNSRPVENVSWNDCQEFCQECQDAGVNIRLPTEREWEYACRAGSTGDWGRRKSGAEGPLEAMGWYHENSAGTTHPVAQKEPNAWGFYDMHGNVWEWCADSEGAFHVRKGGSWISPSGGCTVVSRFCDYAILSISCLGFRFACSTD